MRIPALAFIRLALSEAKRRHFMQSVFVRHAQISSLANSETRGWSGPIDTTHNGSALQSRSEQWTNHGCPSDYVGVNYCSLLRKKEESEYNKPMLLSQPSRNQSGESCDGLSFRRKCDCPFRSFSSLHRRLCLSSANVFVKPVWVSSLPSSAALQAASRLSAFVSLLLAPHHRK